MGCHVGLEFVRVGSGRGFPARLFGGGIEVVGEVLRVGVAHFPAFWETCVFRL